MIMAKSKNFIIVLLAFFFVLFLTMITAMLIGLPRFYSLVHNARYATGVVVSKERENHMSIWFQYPVEGQIFRSAGQAEDLERAFDGIQIGETIPVSYDSTNYGSAVMGRAPEKYMYSSLRGTGFAFVSLIVCFSLYALKRARQ